MNKKLLLMTIGMVLNVMIVSAGNFQIEYGGSTIFTVATSGNVNASGTIAESGVLLSDTYCALAGCTMSGAIDATGYNITALNFVGSGQFLTGITVEPNSTTISYHNITDIPTCTGDTHLTFSGTTLTCDANDDNSINIAGENITSGTIAFARLPTLTDTHTHDYHNITAIPTCSEGQHLYFDGTDLTCTADSGGADLTNYALKNQSNDFVGVQNFSQGINVTGNITFQSDNSGLLRTAGGTHVTIDSSGNVHIKLV